MTPIRRFILKLIALSMATVLLSGCSERVTADIMPVTDLSRETKAGEITPGGELRIPMNAEPATMHPLFVKESQMRNIFSMIFEPLIALDENCEPIPSLAESWSYSPEESAWTIHLRSNVHWHKSMGDVSGSDCAYTVNKILSSPESIYHSTLSDYVTGAEGYDTTLIIHAKTPSFATLYALNIPIIPEAYYADKPDVFMEMPIGSGCFEVTELVFGESTHMVLSSFASWWKKLPYIEKITAVGYRDTEAMLNDLSNGVLDCVPTHLNTTQVYEILDGIAFRNYLSHNYVFLAFNMSRSVMQSSVLRKAIAYGIDRTKIINNVYLHKASGAEQPIFNDSSLSSTSITMYDHNSTYASELLEEAGYCDTDGDGMIDINGKMLTLSLAVISQPENPVRLEAAETVKADLLEIGINVEINALPYADLKKTVDSRDYDMVLSGYSLSDAPDLRFIFYGEGNLSEYSSKEIDEAIKKIDSSMTLTELKQSMLGLQTVFADDLPQIGLFFEMNTFLYRDKLNISTISRESSVYANINTWWLTQP